MSELENIKTKLFVIEIDIYSSVNPLTKIFGPVPTNVAKPPIAAL